MKIPDAGNPVSFSASLSFTLSNAAPLTCRVFSSSSRSLLSWTCLDLMQNTTGCHGKIWMRPTYTRNPSAKIIYSFSVIASLRPQWWGLLFPGPAASIPGGGCQWRSLISEKMSYKTRAKLMRRPAVKCPATWLSGMCCTGEFHSRSIDHFKHSSFESKAHCFATQEG